MLVINEACADYGKQQKNVVKCGKTKAGRQRYMCRTCGHTFTETKGTIFYRRRTPIEDLCVSEHLSSCEARSALAG